MLSAYANAPYLSGYTDLIKKIFSDRYGRIVDMNLALIRHSAACLGIKTPVRLQSRLGVTGKGSNLIIDICRHLGATKYLIQHSARKYYDKDEFLNAGIELIPFTPPSLVYPQLWGYHIDNLSTLDLLLNCGPRSRAIML